MIAIGDLMSALKKTLEEVTGEEVEVTDTEMDELAEPVDELTMDPVEEEMYEELNEAVEVVDTQDIVKKVTRRVAQRLVKESKQDKLAEVLAAKIAAKLG